MCPGSNLEGFCAQSDSSIFEKWANGDILFGSAAPVSCFCKAGVRVRP